MEGFSFPDDKVDSNATGTGNSNVTEDKETEDKHDETEPKKDKQTEEKDGETEPRKDIITEDKQTEEKDVETEPKIDIVTEYKHDETEPKKHKQTEKKDGETEPKKDIVNEDKQTEDKDGETEQKEDIVNEDKQTEDKDIVTEHKENSGSEMEGFSFAEDKAESNAIGTGNRNVAKEMFLNQVKEDFTQAIEHKSVNGSSKESLETFEKGDHVLVAGTNRKLPAMVGDRLEEDDFVEVTFYRKTKDKGRSMLDVLHVVKLSEIECKISPPTINILSRTRAFLEFKNLEDLSVTESSDMSFDI